MTEPLTQQDVEALRLDFMRTLTGRVRLGMAALATVGTDEARRWVLMRREVKQPENRTIGRYERIASLATEPEFEVVRADQVPDGADTLASLWDGYLQRLQSLASGAPAWSANRRWTTSKEGRAAR